MQPISEPGGLNLRAKIFSSFSPKRHRTQFVAQSMRPAPMIPRAGNEVVQMLAIILLQQLIDLLWTIEVFLVPPAGHIQVRHGRFTQKTSKCLWLSKLIPLRMVNKIVPGRELAVKIFRIGVR